MEEQLGGNPLTLGCSVLGRGTEPPQFWVLLIWLEPGISHVTWVHYDATMCPACFVCSVEPDAPPPLRGKVPTPAPKPSPKPSKVAKVAAQPPPEAPDVEALGASVATHVTDACQVLVEQAAATGVEAALAKGRSADHKSALAKAEKVQGNTQRALDQALNLAAKRGEEMEAMREALREAQEGRRKAEVEAA